MRLQNLLIPLLVLTAGCAASTYPLNPQLASQAGLPDEAPSFLERVGRDPNGCGPIIQQGACSWYGPGFHGRRTSNGEVFDKHAMTAAHPTLPFGSELEVTDVDSGKSVRVRVNDRGPFVGHRILDLSYAAASTLGIVGRGVANVQVRLVDVEESGLPDAIYALQVAKFRNKREAEQFIGNLSSAQRSVGLYYIKKANDAGTEYRVTFGPFTSEASANTVGAKLKRAGLKSSIIREDLNGSSDRAAAGSGDARKQSAS